MEQIVLSKLVLLGDAGVGKTSIRKQYMGFGFTKSHLMTLGADFSQKTVKLEEEEMSISLQIWDIAGQEMFQRIRMRFLTNASAVILVFDITRKETFNNLTKWLEEVWSVNKDPEIPILLIGNKVDLSDSRAVPEHIGHLFVQELLKKHPEIAFAEYIETSALTGENIETAFLKLAKAIAKVHLSKESII